MSSTGRPGPYRAAATSWVVGDEGRIDRAYIDITGSSGSGPGMKGRDCQVLLRSPILPFGFPFFSRVLPIRVRPRWCAGVVSSLVSRVEVGLVVPDDPTPSGLVRICWAERRQNRPARSRPWPHGSRARVLDQRLVILLPWR